MNFKKILPIIITIIFGIIVQILISNSIINDYYQITLVQICINIVLALSLNLITGFTGQFSLGHAAFMAIGSYIGALITLNMEGTIAFIIGIVAAFIGAAIISFIIGVPILRLKGDYLAIATLGFGEIVRIVFLNLKFAGGARGLSSIPQHTNWLWAYFFVIVAVIVVSNFINSSHGRACISIREDEIASESMGINTTKYKVLAFVIGSAFAGVAGALYSGYFYFIKPGIFDFSKSVDILVIVVLGGLGNIKGTIVSAVILAFLSTYLQNFPEIRMIVYGVILVCIMLFKNKYPNLLKSKKISSIFKLN